MEGEKEEEEQSERSVRGKRDGGRDVNREVKSCS